MFPTIKWAQTSDYVLFKILIENVTGLSIDFNDNKLNFTGFSNNEKYEMNLEFYNKIDSNLSNHSYKINEYYIDCKVKKDKVVNWDYLIKNQSFHKNHIQIDWLRWVDEENDESQENDKLNNSMKELLDGMYNKKEDQTIDKLTDNEPSGKLNLNGLEITDNMLLNDGVASGESTPCTSDDDENELNT